MTVMIFWKHDCSCSDGPGTTATPWYQIVNMTKISTNKHNLIHLIQSQTFHAKLFQINPPNSPIVDLSIIDPLYTLGKTGVLSLISVTWTTKSPESSISFLFPSYILAVRWYAFFSSLSRALVTNRSPFSSTLKMEFAPSPSISKLFTSSDWLDFNCERKKENEYSWLERGLKSTTNQRISTNKPEYSSRTAQIFIKDLVSNKLMPQILGMKQHQTEWKWQKYTCAFPSDSHGK